jgi:ribosomal-protein-alanine N-acetyltransferase
MTITIETARMHHLNKLREIEKECFHTEAFTKQQISNLLTDYNSISLVAKGEDQIVGFIMGSVCFERNSLTGHILTIDVLTEYRGKQIGTKLLQEMEKLFRERGIMVCRLEVREDNLAALGLYRKFGYAEIGRLKNYYGSAHGIYLQKTLT